MIAQFKTHISSLGGNSYTFKELWKRAPSTPESSSGQTKFCGGRDGSLIATYEMREGSSHIINLYNTRMALVHTYEITTHCEGVYVYVAPSDFVYVLTSRGDLFTFFGGVEVGKKQLLLNGKIRAAAFYPSGFVFMNATQSFLNYDIYWCKDFEQPLPLYTQLNCNTMDMAVIPHTHTASKKPIVFVTDIEQNLRIMDGPTLNKIDGPVTQFALSPDYTKVAARFKDESEDSVLLISLKQPEQSCRINLDQDIDTVCQLEWCGTDFVVIAFDGQLVLVNFHCDPEVLMDLQTDNPAQLLVLVPCCDCCLIVTDDAVHKLEILRSEIDCAISSPSEYLSARLVEACVEKSTTKVMELASEPEKLLAAVNECLTAALQADDEQLQKLFFMSAVFGKSFLGIGADKGLEPKLMELATETASVSQALRVSNAFRTQLSMYVSPNEVRQLRNCTDDLLLRICDRYQFSLALEVARYLNADKRVIFTEWCFARSNKIPPDELVKEILAKRNESFDIVMIIRTLSERGKSGIADSLAKAEPLKARIVPYYKEKDDWYGAIDAASLSGDSDLLIGVIREACEKKKLERKESDATWNRLFSDPFVYSTIAKFVGHNKDHQLYSLLQNSTDGVASSDKSDMEVEFDFWQESYDMRHASETMKPELLNRLSERSQRKQSLASLPKALSVAVKAREVIDKVVVPKTGKRDIGKPLAMIVQELIESGNLSDAKELCTSETCGEEKYYHTLGQVLASKNFTDFKRKLTVMEYQKFWRYYFLLCYVKFGKDQAEEFAKALPVKAKSDSLLKELKHGNETWKSLFAVMDPKQQGFFK